jgi:hypothetical protein
MNMPLYNFVKTIENISCVTGKQFAQMHNIFQVRLTVDNGVFKLLTESTTEAPEQICTFNLTDNADDIFDDTLDAAMFLGVGVLIDEVAQEALRNCMNNVG